VKQTLLTIKHEFFDVPTFGFGWVLMLWTLFSVIFVLWLAKRQGWSKDTLSHLPILLLVAAFVAFVLPRVELWEDGAPLGLPIRGYGVMLLLAIVAAVALGVREARRIGLDPEIIFSLALVCVIAGIVGARLFFVIQYWDRLDHSTTAALFGSLVNVTEGGLVVYGSLLGVAPAALWFFWKHKLPPLAIADVVTPSMMLGLALGRLGCLLNGCCFGGLCDLPMAVSFPMDTPPYQHQLALGQIHGFLIDTRQPESRVLVKQVYPGGPAERAGLQVGTEILSINGRRITGQRSAQAAISEIPPDQPATLDLLTSDGSRVLIELETLPARSRHVHPTQIYSAINASLLCLLFWSWYPRRTRDGQVFAAFLTIYPLTRIILEFIRQDEPGRFGTELTISQWISIGVLLFSVLLWAYIYRRKPELAYPVYPPGSPPCPEGQIE